MFYFAKQKKVIYNILIQTFKTFFWSNFWKTERFFTYTTRI